MGTFANFQENDRSFADELVDDECGNDDEKDGQEGQHKVEFASENVLVRLLEEETKHGGRILYGQSLRV